MPKKKQKETSPLCDYKSSIETLLLFYKKRGDIKKAAKSMRIDAKDFRKNLTSLTKHFYKHKDLPIGFLSLSGDSAEEEVYNIVKSKFPDAQKDKVYKIMRSSFNYSDKMLKDTHSEEGRLQHEKALIKRSRKFADQFSFLSDRLQEISEKPVDIEIIKTNKKVKTSNKNTHCYLVSDIEIGQYIDITDIGGRVEFNNKIANEYLQRFKQEMINIYEEDAVNNCYLFFLGDMVRGTNSAGKWNASYVQDDMLKQTEISSKILSSIIFQASEIYKRVDVVCVSGNHGRAGPVGKEHYKSNWDTIVYKFVKATCSSLSGVNIKIPEQWYSIDEINGLKILSSHGDNVSIRTVNALGSIKSKMCEFLHSIGVIDGYIDTVLIGHHHQPVYYMGKVIVNGSWAGTDVYASKKLSVGHKPSQVMFKISKDGQISFFKEVILCQKS